MSRKQDSDTSDKDRQERRDATRTPPSPQGGPPLVNDGPEQVRDGNC
jgi:hypothetical protein